MTTENKPTGKQDAHDENIGKVMNHDYDGIKELNNPPPYWISLIFILTFAFSMFYVVHFFGYPNNGKDQKSQYEQKVAAFEAKKAAMQNEAGSGVVLSNAEMLADGAKLYLEKACIACHGMNGEGNNIGPNLADNYWIHGCDEASVVKMIREGMPEKGMTPYKNVMTENQMTHLAKYILESLVGSEPANAKAPQGELCQ